MDVPTASSRRREESDYGAGDHGFLKAYFTRESTSSRRSSASDLKRFREETRSFRHANICSTASSPGYISRDQIDPSTYSFTAALKALQAKSVNGWDCVSYIKSVSNGNALNSKWNEAEKYICNPYSGQFPMECLSSKALSEMSLPTAGRMTRSGPLMFSHTRLLQMTEMRPNMECGGADPPRTTEIDEWRVRRQRLSMRDVGTQSNTSLGTRPSVKECSLTRSKWGGSLSPGYIQKPKTGDEELERAGKADHEMCNEGREDKETTKYKSWGCLTALTWALWRPRVTKEGREIDAVEDPGRR